MKINAVIDKLVRLNVQNVKAIFLRYVFYFFGFLEILLLPKFLDSSVYTDYEYYKNAILLFPNSMAGAYSGYIFVKYSKGYDFYKSLFLVGFLITILIAIITCLITGLYFLFFPLLIINLFVIMEQNLKVKKKFIEAFLFKPILSISALLISITLINHFKITINSELLVIAVFLISFLLWLPFVRFSIPCSPFQFPKPFQFRKYYYLVNKIFIVSLASIIVSFMLFFERFIIEKYYSDLLMEYSFVFNLTQILVLLLTVVSYVSSIEYGEKIHTINKKDLQATFKFSFLIFLILFGVYLGLIYIISLFYPNFSNIFRMTFILSLSKGFFFFVGIYSPIAIYKNFNKEMLKTLLKTFGLSMIFTFLIVKFRGDFFLLLISNGILLISYSIYILNIIFRRISYSKLIG